MKIVRYGGHDDVDIEFQDDHHYIKTVTYSNFTRGNVKNPYDRDLFGVGYIGVGKWKVKHNGKWSRVYLCWRHMIERCYHETHRKQYPAYYQICTVCDEWQNYQNFAEWYKAREYEVDERLHLDKDIKYPGNTVYSPETCILIPQKLNVLFTNQFNKRGLPNGIYEHKNGYFAKYNERSLGIYPTVEEAYVEYAKAKKEEIVKVCNEYIGIIPDDVYQAVLAYEFSIENDKNYKG